VIGYPSRQDGAIFPAQDNLPCPARKISPKPYNKSFIDQDNLFSQDGWILALLFFASLWTWTLSQSINTQKKELG